MTTGKKILFGGLGVFAFVVILIFAFTRPPAPPPPMPNPNGIDSFKAAAKTLDPRTSDFPTLEIGVLRSVVASNATALALARVGLTQECRVKFDFTPIDQSGLGHLSEQKQLAQAFAAAGRLAEEEQRPTDAARDYADTVRYGCLLSRGGVIINSLVGIAVEAIGGTRLTKVVDKLDAPTCRELAAELAAADAARDSFETTMSQEHDWAKRSFGLRGRIMLVFTYRSIKQTESRFRTKVEGRQLQTRNLILNLAARAYELEKGAKPGKPEHLVPEYLKAVPIDPTTGTNIMVLP